MPVRNQDRTDTRGRPAQANNLEPHLTDII